MIDLFAGPGGLSEGFSSLDQRAGRKAFVVRLSIEKEELAHQTLELRAFFRQFERKEVPDEYYQHLRRELPREHLFAAFPAAAGAARKEAWHQELGPNSALVVGDRIRTAIRGEDPWVLIGGPPCQAYSLAGRSRNRGVKGYNASKDTRQTLYVEYLQILADHAPSVFIMENVKGLLSATLLSSGLFDRIVQDLSEPTRALARENRSIPRGPKNLRYRLHPLSCGQRSLVPSPEDFVVRAEDHGIPQARHRVILVGIREDLPALPDILPTVEPRTTVAEAVSERPRLRSGLSGADSANEWRRVLEEARKAAWLRWVRSEAPRRVYDRIVDTLADLRLPRLDRGGEYVPETWDTTFEPEWYADSRIRGTVNHSTRGHIPEDLHRYLFAAAYSRAEGRSPELSSFPPQLLPHHANVKQALNGGFFADRFRVQVATRPATTITSHISKDGHYYIHPDPSQCRSLTVREAARLQTFPDNYFFCGGRTAQYTQVGNAVPPLLARQIAAVIHKLLV